MSEQDPTVNKKSLSYKDAGVDIDAGNQLVEKIKPIVKQTFRPEVLSGIGGFGALFELPVNRYREPVLVSGTDGVGTKLKLAIELERHESIGIDLVAMCVNDLIVQGAEPLFFLDYYATGKLTLDVAEAVISGIARGCSQAGASLIGGETAEMPGMYAQGDYDLAGFCVGVVEKAKIIDGSKVNAGDCLVGIASSGAHSNGYSLIRKILQQHPDCLQQEVGGVPLGEALLEPTRIYVSSVLSLLNEVEVRALAHITGGGLPENLPRVLPDGTCAEIHRNAWQRPAVFDWLQHHGNVNEAEMLRTFNCGIGMVVCVPASDLNKTMDTLAALGETTYVLGAVGQRGVNDPVFQIY